MSRCKGFTKRGTGCRDKPVKGNKGMCRLHGETILERTTPYYTFDDDGYVSSEDADYFPGDTLSSDDEHVFNMHQKKMKSKKKKPK